MSDRPKLTLKHCMRLIGRRVIAYHVGGHIYDGVLHSVTNDGIYLMNASTIYPASSSINKPTLDHAISNAGENAEVSDAFFPFLFLPLVALAGLAAARPYPYGYYPGYWY